MFCLQLLAALVLVDHTVYCQASELIKRQGHFSKQRGRGERISTRRREGRRLKSSRSCTAFDSIKSSNKSVGVDFCEVIEERLEAEEAAMADAEPLRQLFEHFGKVWKENHVCSQDGVDCNEGFVLKLQHGWAQTEGELPAAIVSGLSHLHELVIEDHKIVGQLPAEVFALKSLKVLEIHTTGIVGPIVFPTRCGQKLESLKFEKVKFIGEIPEGICTCEILEELELESLLNVTSMPSCISEISGLQAIDLKNSGFAGDMPQFWRWPKLRQLDLAGTRLQGTIPDKFAELGSLREIDFGDTGLRGGIPPTLASKIPYLLDVRLSSSLFGCAAGEEAPPTDVWNTGDVMCRPCAPGRYVAHADVGECAACFPGKFTNVFGSTSCVDCSEGSYVSSQGASACQMCPGESVTQAKGAASIDSCKLPVRSSSPIYLGIVIVVAFLLSVTCSGYSYSKLREISRETRRQKIFDCVSRVNELTYPMFAMPFATFAELTRMIPLEEADARNLLVTYVSVSGLRRATGNGSKIIFISHQWLGWDHPDPENKQYAAIIRGVHAMCDYLKLIEHQLYLWLDYHSIPQQRGSSQIAAIHCLPVYASLASVFLVVAVSSRHRDTGQLCGAASYKERAWCRLEAFSHYSRRGKMDMYIYAEDEHVFDRGSRIEAKMSLGDVGHVADPFIEEIIFVFEGQCSCCIRSHRDTKRCDKEFLRDAVLGLYVEMLNTTEATRSKPASMRAGPRIDDLMGLLSTHQERAFPKFYNMSLPGDRFKRKRVLFGEYLSDARRCIRKGEDFSELMTVSWSIASVENGQFRLQAEDLGRGFAEEEKVHQEENWEFPLDIAL